MAKLMLQRVGNIFRMPRMQMSGGGGGGLCVGGGAVKATAASSLANRSSTSLHVTALLICILLALVSGTPTRWHVQRPTGGEFGTTSRQVTSSSEAALTSGKGSREVKRNSWWSKKSELATASEEQETRDLGGVTGGGRMQFGTRQMGNSIPEVLGAGSRGCADSSLTIDCYVNHCVSLFVECARLAESKQNFVRCALAHRICAVKCFRQTQRLQELAAAEASRRDGEQPSIAQI